MLKNNLLLLYFISFMSNLYYHLIVHSGNHFLVVTITGALSLPTYLDKRPLGVIEKIRKTFKVGMYKKIFIFAIYY